MNGVSTEEIIGKTPKFFRTLILNKRRTGKTSLAMNWETP